MRIAILSAKPCNCLGGAETYNFVLINTLLKWGHSIVEFPSFFANQDFKTKRLITSQNYTLDLSLARNSLLQWALSMYSINKKVMRIFREFDLVIASGGTYIEQKKFNNILFIQHADRSNYQGKYISKFNKILKFILSILTPFKYDTNHLRSCKNVVFYSKKYSAYSENSAWQTQFECPLTFLNRQEIAQRLNETPIPAQHKQITFLGRLVDQDKNVIAMAKELNAYKNLIVVGSGPDMKKLKNLLGDRVKGPYLSNQLPKLFKETRVLILPSIYEGFSIAITEAAAYGIPSVIFDNWDIAKLHADLGVAMTAPYNDWTTFKQHIDKILMMPNDEYSTLQKTIMRSAYENFTIEKFEASWEKIIAYFDKNT